MASRDNQTMQIIVIVLALGFILMSVGLVMVNNSRKTAVAKAKSSEESSQAANRAQNELQSEANNYKLWMGYQEQETYQDLQTTFAEDMQRWGPTFEESNRSFRNILENVFEENRKLAQSESDAKAREKDLKRQLSATQAQTNDQIAKFEADAKKALADKVSLSNAFQKHRQEVDEAKNEIAQQLADQRKEYDTMVTQRDATEQRLEKKITDLQRVIEVLKSKTAIPDPYAQPEDGRIAWVDQREGKVWINIGEQDQLRPQVTFSVYSGDTNDVNAAVSKGSIEVIRLLSAHMAEARITDDKATRPLMEGDKVYSQVWNRGRQIGFAFTGVVDLDGDGSSDPEQLERIIQLNNGKVDAQPSADGGIDGQMTVDTRYLILGKFPENPLGSSDYARKSFQSMSAEADTLNIEVITLDDFLSLMGWKSEHRAVKVGKGARASDFPARPQEVGFKRRPLNKHSNRFRTRDNPQLPY